MIATSAADRLETTIKTPHNYSAQSYYAIQFVYVFLPSLLIGIEKL